MGSKIHQEATAEQANQCGLTVEEFEMIKNSLGKTPSYLETKIYSIIVADQKTFKIANNWLESLPTFNNNGVFELNKGTSCVLAFDSYPLDTDKEIEIIAQVNSFSFGNIENTETKNDLKEVTKEISEAANNSTASTTEGKLFFDELFNDLNLTNTFSVGRLNPKKDTLKNETQEYSLNYSSGKILQVISELLNVNKDQIVVKKEGNSFSYFYNDDVITKIPTKLADLDSLETNFKEELVEPAYYQESKQLSIDDIAEPIDLKEVATFLLKHPNIASKRWLNSQFNSLKSQGGKARPSTDAGIVDIKDNQDALTLTITGNPRYIKADPEIGTALALAEASRDIICSGGEPKAIALSLNIDNLNHSTSLWQFAHIIKGIDEACKKFKTPLTKLEFSFNIDSADKGNDDSILPIPTLGMVGLLKENNRVKSFDFKTKGDLIFIIGEAVECIGSSEYLYSFHGVKQSLAPYFDMKKEYEMQQVLKSMIEKDLVNAAHGCSNGGLFVALTEMAMPNELGFDIVTDAEIREDAFLFGEASGRVLVGVNKEREDDFIDFMLNAGVNFTLLGHVTQGKMVVDDEHYGFIQTAKTNYNTALEKMINS